MSKVLETTFGVSERLGLWTKSGWLARISRSLSNQREVAMPESWQPLIYLEDVTKVFKDGDTENRVLDGIDLEVHAGEYVSIVGPSGCGKSTLLSIVGLMDSPTSGIYCFGGEPVTTLNASARARARNQDIGFVFQNFNLIGDLP